MIKNLPQIVLLNIVGLALFLSGIFPLIMDSGCRLMRIFFISLIRNWSKVRPFVAGCIDQQSRFRRLFSAGDGNVDAEFLAERKRPRRRRIVIMGLVMLLTAVLLNQLGQALIPVKRASPTLTFTDINRVSETALCSHEDASRDSFPGDHGMMLLIFRHSCGVISAKLQALSPLLFLWFLHFPE